MHNTSRVDDEPYGSLLSEKGFTGFPSLCFMDADGNVLIKQGERNVRGFESTGAKVHDLIELRASAAKGGAADLARLLLAEAELGLLDAGQIRERMDKIHLDAKQRAEADRFLVDAEVRELRARARQIGPREVASRVLEMAKAGRRPSEAGQAPFWSHVLEGAATAREAKLAQEAFDALTKKPLPAATKKRYQAQLDEAKGAK